MLHAKQASKRKRRSKAVPVLGAAGLLSLASGVVAQAAGPAANLPTRTIEPSHELTLSEEEVFDVGLATFLRLRQGKHSRLPACQRRLRRLRWLPRNGLPRLRWLPRLPRLRML